MHILCVRVKCSFIYISSGCTPLAFSRPDHPPPPSSLGCLTIAAVPVWKWKSGDTVPFRTPPPVIFRILQTYNVSGRRELGSGVDTTILTSFVRLVYHTAPLKCVFAGSYEPLIVYASHVPFNAVRYIVRFGRRTNSLFGSQVLRLFAVGNVGTTVCTSALMVSVQKEYMRSIVIPNMPSRAATAGAWHLLASSRYYRCGLDVVGKYVWREVQWDYSDVKCCM